MSERKDLWEQIHLTQGDAVSWYQPTFTQSMKMIRACDLTPGSTVLDVGCGASHLVDKLLAADYEPTLLDISEVALARVRNHLGDRAREVEFIKGDITSVWLAPAAYDLWHDRALFHFFTKAPELEAYVKALRRALKPGGFLVLAAFAPDGPEECSGLPVRRYDVAGLVMQLGHGFEPLESTRESHFTPSGTAQTFQYTRLQYNP